MTMVFTAEELDYLLHEHADRLTIVEASLTWCRPCMSFERSFEVRSSSCVGKQLRSLSASRS